MSQRLYTKWHKFIAELQADTTDEWHLAQENAGPSVVQRLRALGAEVMTKSVAPRTGGATYSRYDVYARWPTPQSQREALQLAHDLLRGEVTALKRDVDAADEEYAADRKRLNRSSYRRKKVREEYEPKRDRLDALNAQIRLMDKKKEQD